MALKKVVPVELDDGTVLYIEAQEDTETLPVSNSTPVGEEVEIRRGGQKGLSDLIPSPRPTAAQSMQMVEKTIRAYAMYSLNAFKDFGAANVDEVTLEFGVNLSADAGVPYIANGKAQSNLKITVKCSYGKKTEAQPSP